VRSELGSGKASALLTTTVFKIVGRTGPSVVGYDKALQKIAEAQAHEDARRLDVTFVIATPYPIERDSF
jgi:hypothetical protein